MNIAIIEPQKKYYEEISLLCKEKVKKINLSVNIEVFKSGNEFLKKGKIKLYHCIFLEVEMDGIDGISIKEILEKEKNQVAIIFVTSRKEIMAEAFGRNVYGILEKPFFKRKFEEIFDKVIGDYQQYLKKNKLTICCNKTGFTEGEGVTLINDIVFIKSEHIYTYIYTKQGKYMKSFRKTLKEWEQELTKEFGFYRIHNSYIIHMKYIKEVKVREVIMEDGQKISISRGKIKEFRQLYEEYKNCESIYT